MEISRDKATHQQTRLYNRQLVLRTIYDAGEISRAGIARLTGLNKVTVSEIVAGWIESGVVAEVGTRPPSGPEGGKASILLGVIDDAYHMIGIDISSSDLLGAVVNLRGRLLHTISQPLEYVDGQVPLEQLFGLVNNLLALNDRPLLGIGIGAPGLMDASRGVVRQAVNTGWMNVPLAGVLKERYNTPVYLANDGQVSALAEHTFGAGRGAENLAVVLVNRGVSAGIILDGQLHHGDDFGAGEIGHLTIRPGGDLCRCGRRGCLETVAGSLAIVQRSSALASAHPQSILGQYMARGPLTFEDVIAAYQAGDPDAHAVLEDAGLALGFGIACITSTLNIRRVVLIGSVTRSGKAWLQTVTRELHQSVLPALAENMQLSFGEVHPYAVILGACALLMNREIGFSLAR